MNLGRTTTQQKLVVVVENSKLIGTTPHTHTNPILGNRILYSRGVLETVL